MWGGVEKVADGVRMIEKWINIDGFESYQISNFGRVKRVTTAPICNYGRILKQPCNNDGYPGVTLYNKSVRKTIKIHVLVLSAFVGPKPNGLERLHIDGNPKNNRLTNLRYGTHKENMNDKMKHSRHFQPDNMGEKCGAAKLTNKEVLVIREMLRYGMDSQNRRLSRTKIAKMFGVGVRAIGDIANDVTWRSVK